MTAVQSVPASRAGAATRLRYIDTDVHPTVPATECLYPYMTQSWRKRFEQQGLKITGPNTLPDRYVHPMSSPVRSDALPPSGGPAGSDIPFMREQYLDTYGPEAVVLIDLQPAQLVAWVDIDAAVTLISAYNRYFVEEWLPADPRFTYAMVAAPHDPVQAAAEIREIGQHPGVSAVYLPLIDRLMGHRHYNPIYEAAQEMSLPIITHPTAQECSFQTVPVVAGGGSPASYIERYVDLPQIAQANLSSLMFEGIFERYPRLKFVFVEWGFSWLQSVEWRMDKAWTELRRETPWVKKLPSEYVEEHVRFTTEPVDEPRNPSDLDQYIRAIHGDRLLMFSSDYPHWDNDVPTRVFTTLTLEERHRIFYQNAAETFRFAHKEGHEA